VTTGYNGFPRGIMDDIESRHERPEKYQWTVHAEPNAIANAARMGASTVGCTAYVTKTPCSLCMALLIQAGIVRVVCPRPDEMADEWKDSRIAEEMADEAKVDIIWTGTRNGAYCRSTHQSMVSQ
ncbi:MAG TPA: deaminase, partial [Candidatus Paceibacterota bacterium]